MSCERRTDGFPLDSRGADGMVLLKGDIVTVCRGGKSSAEISPASNLVYRDSVPMHRWNYKYGNSPYIENVFGMPALIVGTVGVVMGGIEVKKNLFSVDTFNVMLPDGSQVAVRKIYLTREV